MTFIRKVKTASGATAVQIVRKSSGRIVKVDHIGSAHTKEDLEVLLSLANRGSTNVDTGGEFIADPTGRFLDDARATIAIGSLP